MAKNNSRLVFQLAILGGLASAAYNGFEEQIRWQYYVLMTVVFGAYFATLYLIPRVKEYCLKADLFGRDINKNSTEKVPESLGVAVGVVFIISAVLVQPLMAQMLGQYNAALLSICLMWFLGFADDVFDLRWAIKIFCSFVATLPLLVAYSGPTNIIVPKPLRAYLGDDITIGYFYHLYMSMTAVFCTNSINIHAGINGIEAGQSAVIAVSIIVHNLIELNGAYGDGHLLSLYIMLPFLACVLALLYFNWYPSQVFVGDSFTYLAGMTFAVSGILGRFSKTLMLFFLPELLNFLLSIPQLLRIIPCPRHRLPKLDEKTGKLNYTKNFTLINATLFIVGPTHERTLCVYMILFQIFCSAVGFGIRYSDRLTNIFYD